MTGRARVLIIDDEKNFADVIGNEIERMGFETVVVYDPLRGLEHASAEEFEVVLLDMKMPGMDGLTALKEIRKSDSPPEVIILTGHATVDTAIDAMKNGAYDYLTKPCKLEELHVLLRKAIEKREAINDRKSLRRYLGTTPPDFQVIGQSEPMQRILSRLDRIAEATDIPVLITGESGTGKELIARELHRRSPNCDEPFVTVNCAVLQSTILESELFGHERGAFTGATSRKIGLFEVAKGGDLFLDEVGETEETIQAKLLRAVQFGEFRRLGGNDTLKANVRIIAATNRDLRKAIEGGAFREDLFYRLNVVQIAVPPLRDRPEDIVPLAEHFLAKYSGRSEERRFAPPARDRLVQYSWPGNVRELENCIRRLLIFQSDPIVSGQDIDDCLAGQLSDGERLPDSLRVEDVEREHILKVYRLCEGNKARTAEKLGIALKTLYNKLNAYRDKGIEVP